MIHRLGLVLVLSCGVASFAAGSGQASAPQEMPAAYREVLEILGRKGDFRDGVLRVDLPRNDLHVSVKGMALPTPFGFGGWIGMTKGTGGMDVMMGDLTLLQEEVNPIMSALLEGGLEVTALHNHFFWEEPRLFYMHVHGHGDAADLARKLKPALDLMGHAGTLPGGTAGTPSSPGGGQAPSVNGNRLDGIVGQKGFAAGAVYKYVVGRPDIRLVDMGATIGTRMGLNSWAAFAGSDSAAAVAGDIAMKENEVNAVLKALRSHGLEVVAIHHHMIGAHPLVVFLHYWGMGHADVLATGFRAALNALGRK